MKVNAIVHAKPDAPTVKFIFVDGSDTVFDSKEFLVQAMKMDDDFEVEGKNVDDM